MTQNGIKNLIQRTFNAEGAHTHTFFYKNTYHKTNNHKQTISKVHKHNDCLKQQTKPTLNWMGKDLHKRRKRFSEAND